MNKTRANCNDCGVNRNHEIMHQEETRWEHDEHDIAGGTTYSLLKCGGCDSIKLKVQEWNSENGNETPQYFPPEQFRQLPDWHYLLRRMVKPEERFVEELLTEIYTAVQNDSPRLAAMGVRALLEQVMITKTGDHGTFDKNIAAFQTAGYVSSKQAERLRTILDLGHATIHRAFVPNTNDLITLIDITEHIIETVYVHEGSVSVLASRIPKRPQRVTKQAAPNGAAADTQSTQNE